MRPEKEDIKKRKLELQKQHDDLLIKIKQGRDALINMETTLVGLKGAIAQCDWTLELYKDENKK
mgnify:CR=1 FL=1|tara:strand:+ start:122 stop:313 length:192 start_codon:yes stop_codon:yes gene_type:complete